MTTIGYVIENEKGNRLTQNKHYGAGDGWIWSKLQVDEIIKESESWEFKPYITIPAMLVDGEVTLIDFPEIIAERKEW